MFQKARLKRMSCEHLTSASLKLADMRKVIFELEQSRSVMLQHWLRLAMPFAMCFPCEMCLADNDMLTCSGKRVCRACLAMCTAHTNKSLCALANACVVLA